MVAGGTAPAAQTRSSTIVAAAIGGSTSVLVGYPLDNIKSRMQVQPLASMVGVVQQTLRTEGVRGFFRGIVPPFVVVSFLKSVSFTTYETSKAAMDRWQPPSAGGNRGRAAWTHSYLAGSVAGVSLATISCPLEIVKIQMQLHRFLSAQQDVQPLFRTSLGCAYHIVKQQGLGALYRAFHIHAFRDAIGTGTYFGCYETIIRFLSPTGKRADASALLQLLAGGFSGMAAWIFIFPVDLVKTSIQKDIFNSHNPLRRAVEAVRMISHKYGWSSFYSGITPTMLRAFPVHAINFLVYEQTLKFFRNRAQALGPS